MPLRRLARDPAVLLWLPVAVLPPVMVADAALSHHGPGVTAGGALAAVAACLPLALRRRLGFAGLAPLLVGGIVLVLWRMEPGTTVVAIPMVALFTYARTATPRRALTLGVGVLPCVLVSAAPFADGGADLVSIVVRNGALCELAIAAGSLVRYGREAVQREVAAGEAEAERRLGEERLRIAREVHDVVAHAMVAINVQSGVAAHLLDRDRDQAREALRAIKRTSGEALADLRATLDVLRDPGHDAPVGPAAGLADLEPLAERLRSAGVRVRLEIEALPPVPVIVHAAGYRIVQEALTNVLRHARASEARVSVRRADGDVRIEVADDGDGDVDASRGSGNGLRGMRERAEALGGTLRTGPADGGGWAVVATLPVAP